MRSFLLVLLLLLSPALCLYSAENPPSPQGQTNLPATQSLGDDPPVTVEPPSLQHRAERGDVEAQNLLGINYEFGIGVPQDYAEARKWYLKAAERGDADAQNNLGLLYYNGEGVAQDYVEARKWWLKAAEQGHATAQSIISLLYSNGSGVPQDYVTAYAWANIAAAQGNEKAKQYRDLAAAKLDAASLGEAQKLSKDYFKRYVEPFQ